MAQMTVTKRARIYEYDNEKKRLVRREHPLPPKPRYAIRVKGCEFDTMVSEGQDINPIKERARQLKKKQRS